MTDAPSGTPTDQRITRLVSQLDEVQRELQTLVGNQVDAVVSHGQRSYLLHSAQEMLRAREQQEHASAELRRAILNAVPANIVVLDQTGGIVAANEKWTRFGIENGGTPEAVGEGANYLDVCDRATGDYVEDARSVAGGIRQVMERQVGEFKYDYECHAPTEKRWCRVLVAPFGEGAPAGAVVMHLNTTAQVEADAIAQDATDALYASEQRYRDLVESSHDLVWAVDTSGRYTYMNKASWDIYQRAPEELIGHLFTEFVPPGQASEDTELLQTMLQRGDDVLGYSSRVTRKDGTVAILSAHARVMRDRSGLPIGISGTARDVTEQIKAEDDVRRAGEELRDVAEQYRLLFQHNPHPMWTYDLDTFRILAVNAAAVRQYGYTEAEFLSLSIMDLRPAEDRQAVTEAVRRATGPAYSEWRHRRRDGTVIDVEVSSDAVMFGGRPARLVLAHDVTQRRRAAARITQQAALIDHANDAIYVRAMDDRIVFWSKGAERLFGWTGQEAIGHLAHELLLTEPDSFKTATEAVLRQGHWDGELTQQTKDGKRLVLSSRLSIVYDDSGRPISVLAIETDITERRRVEQQFLRAQRMESVGTLAGGIAHDLNNVLAPILMAITSLRDLVPGEDAASLIDIVEESGQRAADLVRQVLTFARGVEGRRIPVSVPVLTRELLKVLKDTFPKSITVKMELGTAVWSVSGDPTQLHQVLMNLCVNARDAMPGGGRLTVGVDNVTLDDTYVAMTADAKAGQYVRLSVTDTGPGMTREVKERLFEPFFTTKELGKGTGLGLSTTLAIVRSHGGFINVYSDPGSGTKFHVYLPAMDEAHTPAIDTTGPAPLPRGRGECILVVDDESNIRNVVKNTLERFGYRVLLAANGAEAVAQYVKHRQDIALVLTDMAMPIMDGPALIVALQAMKPDLLIVGSSGLRSTGGMAKALGAGVRWFVPKPYTARAILDTLQEALRPDSQ